MQNLYGTFVIGLGFFAGGFVTGEVIDLFTQQVDGEQVRDFTAIWLIAAGLAAVSALGFYLTFPRGEPEMLEV